MAETYARVPDWSPRETPLPHAPVGVVPLLFANDDLPELTPPITGEHLLDEIARLGYVGTQLSRVLPRGPELRETLARHGVRVAEVYTCLTCTKDGPPEAIALAEGRAKIRDVVDEDGDVLILSYHLSPGRVDHAGWAADPSTPRLTPDGWRRAVGVLHTLAREARDHGKLVVYHPHGGTFVETPDEVEILLDSTDPDLIGLCLDVGHYILGGGDPVAAIRRYASRLAHVHLKDVDPDVLARMRAGAVPDFLDALRARIFSELGSGVLDLDGVAEALLDVEFAGWIMCEQDTSWYPAAEAAAISRRVLDVALRSAARRRTGAITGVEQLSAPGARA
jgi:inosose dehydratase